VGSSAGAAGELDRVRRWVRFAPRAIEAAARVVEGESVRLRAMALTYLSLFALVPALVVAFSVVEAFTGMDRISRLVHEFLLENIAVGARASIEPYLDRFVANAHAGSAGLVGGGLLVWSSVTLFSNVERAVNDIWGLKRRRSLTQQAVVYWMGLTLGPILLAGSVVLSASARGWLAGTGMQSAGVVAGGLLTCAFLATLYAIVPATKVRWRAAAGAGLVAGVAWEIAKWAYALAVARIFRYHAIYGSVAAVPTFMLWLFVSWAILLFGARLAYLFQYASSLRPSLDGARAVGQEVLAADAMLEVALAFDRGAEPLDAGDLTTRARGMPEDVGEAIARLRRANLLVVASDGGLVPARSLEKITLLDVRRAVEGPRAAAGEDAPLVEKIVNEVEDQAAERLAATSFRDLVERARKAGADAPTAEERDDRGRLPRKPSMA
jgi:membrane protein